MQPMQRIKRIPSRAGTRQYRTPGGVLTIPKDKACKCAFSPIWAPALPVILDRKRVLGELRAARRASRNSRRAAL